MTEILPGIHWLSLPISIENSTLSHINVYLIRGQYGYLLIDSGWNTDSSFAAIHNYLLKNNLDFEDIGQIFVTHAHPDHYGMAGRIARLSGAPIMMHPTEGSYIEPRYLHMDELLQQTDAMLAANGVPIGETADLRDATRGLENYVVPAKPERFLHHGDIITTGEYTFEVRWTPGHSSGHICLYEPEKKIFISGDHILPQITPNVSVNPESIENPLGRYIESLHELRSLDVNMVLPGHDRPFTEFQPRIDAIIKHHEWRNAEILAAMNTRPFTAYQAALRITWGNHTRFIDLPAIHQRMAVFETIAHLEMMTAGGKLDKFRKKGIIYYQKN